MKTFPLLFVLEAFSKDCCFCISFLSKVGIPIAIFLWSGAEVSDKIVEVIKKNTRFQYEHSLAARSDIYRVDQERRNDVAVFS
jgi:hypothetical protein